MTQYKFRGKRKDNGKWVYGLLVMGVFNDTMIQVNENGFYHTIVVITETVGMWSGWNDKNGKAIYADDTLQGIMHEQDKDNGSPIVGNVYFKQGGFEVFARSMCSAFGGNDIDRFCFHDSGNHGRPDYYWQIDNIEVIGNIHDVNPASGQSGINHMQQDPNLQAADTTNEQATTEQVAAVEQEAQEQAMDSAEEGGTEG